MQEDGAASLRAAVLVEVGVAVGALVSVVKSGGGASDVQMEKENKRKRYNVKETRYCILYSALLPVACKSTR